jgi:N-hydroxyarylamine O-acetyltransferase
MTIHAYLERIAYTGTTTPTLATLKALHRQHMLSIPYENLDIHLGRKREHSEQAFFEYLVTEKRGGWCFEMNGLFAWALRQLGFKVTLLAATVNRERPGGIVNNHLLVLVDLGERYIADVGFGNGLLEPIPLCPGCYQHGFRQFVFSQEGDTWIFAQPASDEPAFDFTLAPFELMDFSAAAHHLKTSADSGFVQVSVCHRVSEYAVWSLRGALLTTLTAQGKSTRTITTLADYQSVLEALGLQLPEVAALWEKVWRAHQAWLIGQGKL